MDTENNSTFEKSLKLIAKSSVIVFIGVILSKIFTYLYRIIIARQFGPEVYGLFSLAIMLSSWFIVASSLGLGRGLLRYIAIYRSKKEINKIRYLFRKALFSLFIIGIIAGAILFSLSPFIANTIFNEPGLVPFLRFFSLVIPLGVILTVLSATLRAYEKIGWNSFIVNILSPSLKVILILIFIFIGLGINAVIFSYVLGIFFVFLAAFFICRHKISEVFTNYVLSKKIKSQTFKEIISYSWPLLFTVIIWRVFEWTDSFLIGYFRTATEVGIYNAAVPIAMLIAVSTQLFMQLFFPLVTRSYHQGDKKTVKQISQQVGKWIFIINLPIFILLILFPEAFLNILFGPEYLGAATALRFFSIGVLFFSLFEISSRLMEVKGKSKIILFDMIIIFILNIILNIILIPPYGIVGAAIATMSSFIVLSLIFAVQSFYYLSIIPIKRKMFNVIIAAIISTTLLVYIRGLVEIKLISLVILAAFFFISYILLVFLFKGLDRNDMIVIKDLINKIFKKS